MIQVQIQALLAAIEEGTIRGPNTGSNIKGAKPPVFSREVEKIGRFITAYRLYLRIKMKDTAIEE